MLRKNNILVVLVIIFAAIAVNLNIKQSVNDNSKEVFEESREVGSNDSYKTQLVANITKKYRGLSLEDAERIVTSAIRHASTEYEFPSEIDILAVIAVESSFNCGAVNKDDHGCMQLNKKYWGGKFPEEAFKVIEANIQYGVLLLNQHYFRNNYSVKHALLVYNSGQTAVLRGTHKEQYFIKFNRVKQELLGIDI